MIGIIYLAVAFVSDAGARIKELIHDSNAHIDPRTDTYINYSGQLIDASTGEFRHWGHDKNGDEVLFDKKHRVVKNISAEEREHCIQKAKNNNSKNVTACHVPNQMIEVKYTDGLGLEWRRLAALYLDICTGNKMIKVYLPKEYTDGKGEVQVYAYANDPFHVIRMTDEERKIEKCSPMNDKNWIKHPEKEKRCIDKYNRTPIGFGTGYKCHVRW